MAGWEAEEGKGGRMGRRKGRREKREGRVWGGGLFWINDVWILFWVDRVGYI